jgi:hypothetical protein
VTDGASLHRYYGHGCTRLRAPPAGDRGGTETPAAKAQSVQGVSESGEMPGTEGNRILNYFFFGASKNSQLPFLASFLV